MNESDTHPSPRWGATTKLIAGLSFIGILAFLLVRFQYFLGPLLLTFILAYLIYPAAAFLVRLIKLPWRIAVTLIYLVLLVVFFGLLTVGGFALVNQVQSLINFINQALTQLPDFLKTLSQQQFVIGPFQLDFTKFDLSSATSSILGVVQPMVGQMGGLVGRLASSAASLFGWIAFIMIVSYFILVETGGIPDRLLNLQVPGYDADLRRLGMELSRVWNAFLRNQLIIFAIYVLLYFVLLSFLGVKYALGLALLAGLAKFIPYIGPLITWTTFGLVAIFQGSTAFGLAMWPYVLVVVITSTVIDTLFDNFVTTRMMASALKLHPAAVLVGALVGANFLGLVGVVLAAPVLATLKLFTDYVMNKMFDRDPWAHFTVTQPKPSPLPPVVTSGLEHTWQRLVHWLRSRAHVLGSTSKEKQK
jgi:predicted PurR-regulated permease PerM